MQVFEKLELALRHVSDTDLAFASQLRFWRAKVRLIE